MNARTTLFLFAWLFIVPGFFFDNALAQDQSPPSAQATNLSNLQERYLASCSTIEAHNRQIQYQLSRIPFTSLQEARLYADSLQGIKVHIDSELTQCDAFHSISATLSTVLDLFEMALKSHEIKRSSRSLFFYYEDVPDIYQDDIEDQILTEVDHVESVFEQELDLPPGEYSLVFYITNRRIMERDVGGANIGSFIWLPLEFSLGYGQQWPDGVRESTLRHEIVHAFTNHVSESPIEHAYPKVFTEGIALYLSDNRIIEYHKRTQVRLSDEYIDFLRTFDFMEEKAGRESVLEFIRDILLGKELNFSYGFEQLTGIPYTTYSAPRPSLLERTTSYIQNTLRIPRRWQRYISVLGALIGIALLFLTVRLPQNKREEVRRNIGIALLTFVIITFLSQGRLVEIAANNYLAFILLTIFAAVLLRGYPYVQHEDLMEDLREKYPDYWDEEEGDIT